MGAGKKRRKCKQCEACEACNGDCKHHKDHGPQEPKRYMRNKVMPAKEDPHINSSGYGGDVTPFSPVKPSSYGQKDMYITPTPRTNIVHDSYNYGGDNIYDEPDSHGVNSPLNPYNKIEQVAETPLNRTPASNTYDTVAGTVAGRSARYGAAYEENTSIASLPPLTPLYSNNRSPQIMSAPKNNYESPPPGDTLHCTCCVACWHWWGSPARTGLAHPADPFVWQR